MATGEKCGLKKKDGERVALVEEDGWGMDKRTMGYKRGKEGATRRI